MSEPAKKRQAAAPPLRELVRAHFERAANHFHSADALHAEVGQRLLERLELMKLAPRTILDVGCGGGRVAWALSERYAQAQVLGVDLSLRMLQSSAQRPRWFDLPARLWRRRAMSMICGDFHRLPLAGGSCDLVCCNLALHWSERPEAFFAEAQRVLRQGGLLLFTTLGPDTLQELRAASRGVDESAHVHDFIDMHDLGDALVHSRLADPVMDMEHLTLTYERVEDLVRDLRWSGSQFAGRRQHLLPRTWLRQVTQNYQTLRCETRLPATFEIIHGHAWKPPGGPRRTAEGHAVIQLQRPAATR